jgi:hypothetical protein
MIGGEFAHQVSTVLAREDTVPAGDTRTLMAGSPRGPGFAQQVLVDHARD